MAEVCSGMFGSMPIESVKGTAIKIQNEDGERSPATWRLDVFLLADLKDAREWVQQNVIGSDVTVRCPYVMVVVSVPVGETLSVEGVGFAKCSPRDQWDMSLGVQIATGRAQKDAALQVLEQYTLVGRIGAAVRKASESMARVCADMEVEG